MIIFYDKVTGKIEGTIDGRVHTESHLKMWVGDPTTIERIIVNWEATGVEFNEQLQRDISIFEPIHPQKELFIKFDNGSEKIQFYKVDPLTKKIIHI